MQVCFLVLGLRYCLFDRQDVLYAESSDDRFTDRKSVRFSRLVVLV